MNDTQITTRQILSLAVEIGEEMLKNGAEIYRVEEAIIHILRTFEIHDYNVYVISNGIFASANESLEDACSIVRNVPLGSVNLEKISLLNQLTRDICACRCSIFEAWERLDKYNRTPGYSKITQVFFCGLGSGCFCYLFGGKPVDAVLAFIIGLFEELILLACQKYKLSKFTTNILASFYVAVFSFIMLWFNLPMLQDKVIIGSIMPLVPGIAFTTSIRDFYRSDYLSGTIHLVDALITAVCVAIGATLPFFLVHLLGGSL